MPVKKNEQKEHARYLYLNTTMTQKEIATAVSIDPKTLHTWIRNENWAEHKRITFYSPGQSVQSLYEELREIDNNIRGRDIGMRFGTKEEIEARTKILNLIMGPLKNAADKWRDAIPDYEPEPPASEVPRNTRRIYVTGLDPFYPVDDEED